MLPNQPHDQVEKTYSVKESYLQRTSTVRPIFRLLPLTKAEPNPVRATGWSPSFQVVPLLLMPGHWRNMEGSNLSQETAFKLLGLTRDPQLQKLLFTVFLGTHTITVLGSLIMFLLIHMSALHIPGTPSWRASPSRTSTTPPRLFRRPWWTSQPRGRWFPILAAWPSCSSVRVSPPVSALSLPPWPMTAMLPFVTPCHASWDLCLFYYRLLWCRVSHFSYPHKLYL